MDELLTKHGLTLPFLDAALAHLSELRFFGGEVYIQRDGDSWIVGGEKFQGRRFETLTIAIKHAQSLERDLGYHYPTEHVFERCRKAVKAAGWEACEQTSDQEHTTYRPPGSGISQRWVSIPRKKYLAGKAENALRMMATETIFRCRANGIVVALGEAKGST